MGRRFAQQRRLGLDHGRRHQIGVTGGGADVNRRLTVGNAGQPWNSSDVDQVRRRRKAQFHDRNQRVPSGQNLGLVAVQLEQGQRFRNAQRAMVFKGCWIHGLVPRLGVIHGRPDAGGRERHVEMSDTEGREGVHDRIGHRRRRRDGARFARALYA